MSNRITITAPPWLIDRIKRAAQENGGGVSQLAASLMAYALGRLEIEGETPSVKDNDKEGDNATELE